MNKLLTLICFLLIGSADIKAQADRIAAESIRAKAYYKKINQTFGTISTGQSEAANGANYGSFEPVNGSFKFNFASHIGPINKKQVAFFNISAGGKVIGDNVAVLFNNSKFSKGFDIKAKIHLPIFRKCINDINVSNNEVDTIESKIGALLRKRLKDSLDAERSLEMGLLNNRYNVDNGILTKINDSLAFYNSRISSLNTEIICINSMGEQVNPTLNESLQHAYKKVQQLYDAQFEYREKVAATAAFINDSFRIKNSIAGLIYSIDTTLETKRDALEMSVTVRQYRFLWLTLIGSLERKKYYTFSDNAIFTEQFKEEKYTSHEYGIELNLILFGGKRSESIVSKSTHTHILNLGITHLGTNNIGDLTTTELTDSRKFSSHDSTHSLGTKYNVYTDPVISYEAWKFYFNYHYYIGKKQNMALHFFPDVELRDTKQNPFNIGLGLVFSMKNKKDAPAVNVELYAKLVDAGKALAGTEDRLINRNEIGFHVGVPLNF